MNVEDPPYLYPEDLRDRTAEVDHSAHPPFRIVVPAGGSLEVTYPIDAAGQPRDPDALPDEIMSAYKGRFPFEYRLDRQGDLYTFVAVAGRDATGRKRRIVPVFDHDVEIDGGERPLRERVELFGEALSRVVHARVACCGDTPALRFLERRTVRGSYTFARFAAKPADGCGGRDRR